MRNSKKFEEGVFSDLRNLKSGIDSSLEESNSAFLDFLHKSNCIRTQKKQKVFFWHSVPHDKLLLRAIERDLQREQNGQEPATTAMKFPGLYFPFSHNYLPERMSEKRFRKSKILSSHQEKDRPSHGGPFSLVTWPVNTTVPPRMEFWNEPTQPPYPFNLDLESSPHTSSSSHTYQHNGIVEENYCASQQGYTIMPFTQQDVHVSNSHLTPDPMGISW